MATRIALTFDVGGTKIAAGLLDEAGQVLERAETPTRAEEGAEKILLRVETLGRELLARAPERQVAVVGMASAGQIDAVHGVVTYATTNLPGWSGLHLAERLTATFGLPAAVDNDVNAMALAEQAFGVGRGMREFLCVMVGTGIGGALVAEGHVLHGQSGGAGEIGHMSLDNFNGRPCNCGGTGCLEMYASSRALRKAVLANTPPGQVERRLGKTPDEVSIRDLAAEFNAAGSTRWPELDAAVEEAARWLGWGLAQAANLLNPQSILIGGSIQLFGAGYLAEVTRAYRERSLPSHREAALVYSTQGSNAALSGAAVLAFAHLDNPAAIS